MRFILTCLAILSLCAEELPANAQRVANTMAAEILASKQKALRELQKIATDLGRQSDLDTAIIVKKAADDLAADIASSEPNIDVLGNPKAAGVSVFNGRWLSNGKEYDDFELKDGVYKALGTAKTQAQWASGTVSRPTTDTVIFTSTSGSVNVFKLIDQNTLLLGNGVVLSRAKGKP